MGINSQAIILDGYDKEKAAYLLSLLRPMGVINHQLTRIGQNGDGGYLMINEGLDNNIVYNFGIADEVSWDLALAERGCLIWQYDHTIITTTDTHANFKLHPLGLAAMAGEDMRKTIREALDSNEHSKQRDMLLNIDVEGHEWKVFNNISSCCFENFLQIVVELHLDISYFSNHEMMDYAIAALENVNKTHQVVHVHGNNNGHSYVLNGFLLPSAIEVTFLNRKEHSFEGSHDYYPRIDDFPCNENKSELILGLIGDSWKMNVLW